MKRAVSLILALVMVLTLFAACGNSNTAQNTPAATNPPVEPVPQDTTPIETPDEETTMDADQYVNVVLSAEPSVLDVVRFLGIIDRTIFHNILEPLVRIENGAIVPAGAESWVISEDGLTYTFTLRENYWQDGQKVVAEDYAGAIRRQADPANAHAFASDMFCIKNFEAVNTGAADLSTLGVSCPDEKTLVIELDVVNVDLLGTVEFYPERADKVAEYGDKLGTEVEYIIGCGPFVLDTWVHNSELKFVRNEKYWDAEHVYLNRFSYMIIPDANAQLASLENGTIDWLGVSDANYVEKFSARDDMTQQYFSTAKTFMVVANCKDEVFSNEKIRQAFSIALSRDLAVQLVTSGTATPAYGLIPYDAAVGSLDYREEVAEPLKAVIEANPDPKALLIEGMKEAGLGEDPSKLNVTFGWGGTSAAAKLYAELFQQVWQEALGVTVELVLSDSATHMSNISSGNYQMATASWGSNPEPQFQLSRWVTGGQSHWVNEEYATLVKTASQTVDEKERLRMYAEAEEMLVQSAAIMPCYYMASRRFTYNYVKGVSINAFDNVGMKYVFTEGRDS